MFSVNTNLGALAALQSLNATQGDLTATQNRVATGKKVSSASDNPAVYAIAQAMNDRLAGLAAVSDNLNFAQSVIGTAQAAATQISSQLATLKNTVTQGQQSGIDSTTMNNQITAILSNIDSIAKSATFNGVNIAGGTGTDNITGAAITTSMNVTQDMAGTTIAVAQQDITSSGLSVTNLTVASGGTRLTTDNSTAFAIDDYMKLGDGTHNYYFVLSDGSAAPTAPHATDANNSVFFVNFGASDSTSTVLSKVAAAMQGQGFGAAISTVAGPTGSNIGAGDLVVTGKGITNAGSSLSLATAGGATLAAVSGTSAAITNVDSAIRSLNSKIATLGQKSQQISGMQSFSSALSNALSTGLGALTDADMAAESAKLQSLQTKQQLGIQALSIANQQPQSLLSLFR